MCVCVRGMYVLRGGGAESEPKEYVTGHPALWLTHASAYRDECRGHLKNIVSIIDTSARTQLKIRAQSPHC